MGTTSGCGVLRFAQDDRVYLFFQNGSAIPDLMMRLCRASTTLDNRPAVDLRIAKWFWKGIETMVARDGIEPPTPAFSEWR